MEFLKALAIGAMVVSLPVHAMASESVKTVEGIKAILKLDPAKSMVDLYLSDSKTGTEITGAKVKATITMPDGERIEKELMGMKMGASFSFMNSLNMSGKGRYIFDIMVNTGKARARFNFIQAV